MKGLRIRLEKLSPTQRYELVVIGIAVVISAICITVLVLSNPLVY